MVKITESFTKLYGRPPTESELATMMAMKAEQDARKNRMVNPRQDIAEMSKRSQEQFEKPKSVGRPESNRYRWPYRASQVAQQINKMLIDNITIERMAYYMNISEAKVISEINKWGLPQK